MGGKSLRVEETVGLNYLDYLHQEMKGRTEEVSLRKSFQRHLGSHQAARARREGCALSERAGHQAMTVDEGRKGVPVSKSAQCLDVVGRRGNVERSRRVPWLARDAGRPGWLSGTSP